MKNNVYLDICFHRVSTELTTVHRFHSLFCSITFVRQDSQTKVQNYLKGRTCIFNNPPRSFALPLSVIIAPTTNFLLCTVWQPRLDGIYPWWNFNFYDGAFLLAIYQRSQLPATPFKYEGGNCAPSLVFPRYTAED